MSAYTLVAFTLPAAPGSITITGAPARPQAALFLSTYAAINSQIHNPRGRHSWGVATRRNGVTQQAATAMCVNGATPITAKRIDTSSACLIGLDGAATAPVVFARASLVDFTPSGCILEVTATPPTPTDRNVWVLFITGVDDAEVLTFAAPPTAGDLVLSAHFKPSAMIVGGGGAPALDTISAHACSSVGMVAGAGKANQRLSAWRTCDGIAYPSKSMGLSGGYALAEAQPDGPTVYDSAYVSAWGAASVTITWDVKFDSTPRRYFALLLRGPRAFAGHTPFVPNIGMTPPPVTGLPFTPAMVFTCNTGDNAPPSATGGVQVFWTPPVALGIAGPGITTGPGTDVRLDSWDLDGGNGNCGHRMSENGAFHGGDFGDHHISSTLAAFTPDGWTMNASTGLGPMAVTSQLLYLALSEPVPGLDEVPIVVPQLASYHQDRAAERLTQQFREGASMPGVVRALAGGHQALEDAAQAVRASRDIASATGAQLDLIGAIVGQARQGRADEAYRTWIRARMRLNRGSGTAEDVIAVFRSITQAANAIVVEELFPAGFVLKIGGTTVVDPAALGAVLQAVRAAGVSATLEASTTADASAFAFDPNGAGFGDANNPATGGAFIGAF